MCLLPWMLSVKSLGLDPDLIWGRYHVFFTLVLNKNAFLVKKSNETIKSDLQSAQICLTWLFSLDMGCTLLTVSPSHYLSLPHQVPSSIFSILPLHTPSFLCLLLLPWFTFSANFFPFFVKSPSLFTESARLNNRNYWKDTLRPFVEFYCHFCNLVL